MTSVSLLLILWSTNVYTLITLTFIAGLCAPGRTTIGFCYLCEMLPYSKRLLFTTMNSILCLCVFIVILGVLSFVSNDYRVLFSVGIGSGIVAGLVVGLFLDESPLYLLKTG